MSFDLKSKVQGNINNTGLPPLKSTLSQQNGHAISTSSCPGLNSSLEA